MIWLWLYLAGYALTVVPMARWFLRDAIGYDPDPADIAFAAFMGLMNALFWPLLIPGYFVYRTLVKGLRQEDTK